MKKIIIMIIIITLLMFTGCETVEYILNDIIGTIDHDNKSISNLEVNESSTPEIKQEEPIISSPDNTPTPTSSPISTPKEIIIQSPSPTPTLTPTIEPTEKPTIKPTKKPVIKSTHRPTSKPAIKPTTKPTIKPTEKPTLSPEPIKTPTPVPTSQPTPKPTQKPIVGVDYMENITPASSTFIKKVVAAINAERKKAGVDPVKLSSSFSADSKSHAIAMAKTGKAYHSSNPGGCESVGMHNKVIPAGTIGSSAVSHVQQLKWEETTRIGIGIVYYGNYVFVVIRGK